MLGETKLKKTTRRCHLSRPLASPEPVKLPLRDLGSAKGMRKGCTGTCRVPQKAHKKKNVPSKISNKPALSN